MTTGKIARVDHRAEFAFATRDDGHDDLFVSYAELDHAGVVFPRVGISLSFNVAVVNGRPRAIDVQVIDN